MLGNTFSSSSGWSTFFYSLQFNRFSDLEMYTLYNHHDKERIIVILQKMDCDVGLGGGWRGEFQDDDKSGSAAGRDGFFHQTSNQPSITSLSWSGWPTRFPQLRRLLDTWIPEFILYFSSSCTLRDHSSVHLVFTLSESWWPSRQGDELRILGSDI